MKESLSYLTLVLFLLLIAVSTGCTSAPQRRHYSGRKIMRVAIDIGLVGRHHRPAISHDTLMMLQHAIHENGAWVLVDRGAGFEAINEEQDRVHESQDRFSPTDYSRWSSLYGVDAVIIPGLGCELKTAYGDGEVTCLENLSLISAHTGEILAVGQGKVETENRWSEPNWGDSVDNLTQSYLKQRVNENSWVIQENGL